MQREQTSLLHTRFHGLRIIAVLVCVLLPGLVATGFPSGCSALQQCLLRADCPPLQHCEQGQCTSFSPTDASDNDRPPAEPTGCPSSCSRDQDCQVAGCSGAPRCLQSRCIPTELLYRVPSGKVDILFVLDNSGSMAPKLQLLQSHVSVLANDLKGVGLQDFQAGAISTDMTDPTQQGRLLGNPKIINFKQLGDQALPALTRLFQQGNTGASFEKGLDAIRTALSLALKPDSGANQGLLREQSMLAIFIITDEDDCSHNGKILEDQWDSEVCYLPGSETLKDLEGNDIVDGQGKKVRGQMEHLTPVQKYIDYLHTLRRPIVIYSLMGSPVRVRNGSPTSDCKTDTDCKTTHEQLRCGYITPQQRACGGCDNEGFSARPGFRYQKLLQAFGDFGLWAPICGKEQVFREGMERFANQIIQNAHALTLDRPIDDLQKVSVELIVDNAAFTILPAQNQQKVCTLDKDCEGMTLCGPNQQCFDRGWVYYPPTANLSKARLRFSGGIAQSWPGHAQIRIKVRP